MSDCIQDSQGVCICGDPMRQRIAELEAQLAECRAVLREVEWEEMGDVSLCRICSGLDPKTIDCAGNGHAPDCRLAEALHG